MTKLIRGIYTAAAGMVGETFRLETSANNLANVNTPGYKRDVAVFRSFSELLIRRVNDLDPGPLRSSAVRSQVLGRLGTGAYIERIQVDQSPGAARRTDNPKDVAIEGEGFFQLETPGGVRFARSLSLTSVQGVLSANGYPVLGENGRILLTGDDFTVDQTGTVSSGGAIGGRLAVVKFPSPGDLAKQGETLFAPTPGSGQPEPATEAKLEPGFLEAANVNPVTEMVEMVSVMRAYEANQKALQAQDQSLDKLINEVARV